MAEAASDKDEKYDVFLVHSSEDNEVAHLINQALHKTGFKTYAHYEQFPAGRLIFDNIIHAVNASKITLILLTKQAMQSQWVTFEVLMGLEKSHREDKMCVRLVFQGVSEKERTEFKRGAYHCIPDVVIDVNKDSWEDDLAAKLREEVSMRQLLPAGNVAHGLVFNYYIGFLAHVLPETAKTIEACEFSKQGKFSQKFFVCIPDSCKISPLEGKHGEYDIEKMDKTLNMDIVHGDKRRKYNPIVYKISKKGSDESYFFTADTPFILATMSKMNEMGFVEIDLQLQVVRFRVTLMELVQHRLNLECNDTATFISYNDQEASPASAIWNSVVEEFTQKTESGAETIKMKKAHMFAAGKEITATVNLKEDIETDREIANEIELFLSKRKVDFRNGVGQNFFSTLKEARWNIFILSEEAVTDKLLSARFQAALACSISDNEVQVIPILAGGSDIANIPYNFKWTTLLKKDEPDYLEKLWKTMQEHRKMMELLPAGVVHEGLAYAYLINYIPFNLTYKTESGKDFRERFNDAKTTYKVDCPCVPKMFVIVPKSCSFPPPGSVFSNEEHLGPLEAVVLGPRKYFLQLYRLTMSNGKKVCYAREYATPAVSLHDMAELPFAGLNKEEMNKQAKQFAEFSETIMQNPIFNAKIGDVRDKCEMVYFDDEQMGMDGVTTVLEERLMKYIKSGSVI